MSIFKSWFGGRKAQKRTTPRAKLPRRRFQPTCELLENRTMPTANAFLQGTVFVDTNHNGLFDTSESPLLGGGATINLYQLPNLVTPVATTTSDPLTGNFFFSDANVPGGLSAATYQLVEIPPPGFGNTDVQILSQVDPASRISANTIQVTLPDPASLVVHFNSDDFFARGLYDNITIDYKTMMNVPSTAGQLPISVSGTGIPSPGTPQFLSFCWDLDNSLLGGQNDYPVTPMTGQGTLSPPISNTGQIAYLFNHYGTLDLDRIDAVGLQVAIWELGYGANFTLVAAGNPSNGMDDTAAVQASAANYISVSTGKNETAIFLEANGTSIDGGDQGVLATGSFDFGNAPGPGITTTAMPTTEIVGGPALEDTAHLTGGTSPTGTITFTLTGPSNTVVDTEMVPVNGNGDYTTPTGYVPTQVGTYYWVAAYSGDVNNAPAVSGVHDEPVVITPSSPAITTTTLPSTEVVGTGALKDSAILSGGSSPTGTITFTLTSPSSTVVDTETVPVSGDGTYTTPTGSVPTQTGTYYWVATYSGDSNNNGVTSGVHDEPVVISPSSPAITTTAVPSTEVVGTGALKDSATLSGGLSPTGTITFTLTSPSSTVVDTETVPVSGDGTYTTPTGSVPTQTGTYYWVASYSGDSNNNGVTSGVHDEPVVVTPSGPAITTTTMPSTEVVGTGALKDSATLSGGLSPTGTITFTLTSPSSTVVDTETVPVSGDGTYTTPTGSVPTQTGTYYWVATYSGDSNNNGVTSGVHAEPVVVTPSSPAITTTTMPSTEVVGTGALKDSATLSGGFSPTGTITFTLTSPSSTVVDTETVPVSGDGTYTTPTGSVPTQTGTYYWVATYSGDSNNNGVTSGVHAEPVVVTPSSPAITTTTMPSTEVVGTGALKDSATLSGGLSPTGTITFTLTSPSSTVVDTETVPVSGDGTYTTPTGSVPTQTGTYYWVATYSGDSNNNGVTSGVHAEPVVVTPSGPAITTTTMPSTEVVGTGALKDSATLSGGLSPTGTITFTLTSPSSTVVDTETVPVSGDGTYTTPTGSVPTQTGTYYWVATYSGDSNNNGVTSGVHAEPVVVTPSSPAITTTPSMTTMTGPGGQFATIGFWHNKNGQAAINGFNGSSSSTLLGNSLASNYPHLFGAPNPYTSASLSSFGKTSFAGLTNAQVATTYLNLWTPSGLQKNTYVQAFAVALGLYAGGGAGTFNVGSNGAAFGVANNTTLPVTQILQILDSNFSPSTGLFYSGNSTNTSSANTVVDGINSTETFGGATVVSTGTKLQDSATLSGGYHETGTITFYLFAPGVTPNGTDSNNVYSDTVTVNGNGTYNTSMGTNPGGYMPTATGTYQWVAVYGGDSNNNSVTSPFGSEPWVVGQATGTFFTTPGGSVVIGSGTKLTDTATLADAVNPTGTITFYLFAPGVTPNGTNSNNVYSDTVTVNGNGNYDTSTGANAGGYLPTVTGTYQWVATYSGDNNNNSAADSNFGAEPETVSPASPMITTTPNPTSVTLGTMSVILKDSATLSGGYSPTGTITFTLYSPTNTLVDTETATVSGNGTYTTPTGYTLLATAATGIYQWDATYTSGNGNNVTVSDNNDTAEQVVVAHASVMGAISGTKYQDVTGNGFSADDKPLAGVTINLYVESNSTSGLQLGSGGDHLQASATTDSSGNFTFTNLPTGTYYVQEVVPSSYLQTGGGPNTTSDGNTYYTVNVTSAQTYGNNNFDDFHEICNPSEFTNITYTDVSASGAVTHPTTLAGNTHQGDTITVSFTWTGTDTGDNATLVSYIAPNSTFDNNNLMHQVIFQQSSVPLVPGTTHYSLTVTIPNCYYQLDFVCGLAIDHLATGPNISYHAQNRFIAGDTGGTQACATSSICGTVFADKNGDCIQQTGEAGIANVTVTLTGHDFTGAVVNLSTTTNSSGQYTFSSLQASDKNGYTITETQPSGYTHEGQMVGSTGGTTGNHTITTFLNTNTASTGNNFCEVVPVTPAQLSGIVFCDTNLNGVLDTGEKLEAGAIVTLTGGSVTQTATTNASGVYTFSNLAPGTYTVKLTTPASGDVAELSHGSVVIPTSRTVTLTSGGSSANNNFPQVDIGSVSGTVFLDLNDDGLQDNSGDTAIAGATMTLTGTNYLGNAVSQTATTDANGHYTISNVLPSNSTGYTVTETPPAGFVNGVDKAGTINGTCVGVVTGNGVIAQIVLPGCNNAGINYNYGDQGIFHGETATIGFWHNKNGQALINSFGTTSYGQSLANTLATNLPNLFGKNAPAFNVNSTIGTNLTGRSNSDVAAYFLSLFGVTGPKTYAQVLATCLAAFTTSTALNTGSSSQSLAKGYGFILSSGGVGSVAYTVSTADWAAFGITSSSGATQTVNQLVLLVNKYAVAGKINGGNTTLVTEVNDVFNDINNKGDITG